MSNLNTNRWNLTGLIGAFLNLSIAYMLLCTSLSIHLLLRLLEFLGFSLPRFHNGRFGDPNARKSLQMDLVDYATERISFVDRSIKSKVPFGSIGSDDDDSNRFVEMKLVRKNSFGDISNAKAKDETEDVVSREEHNNNNVTNGRINQMRVQGMKGKRFATRRSRNGLKHHRRGRAGSASLTSVSSLEVFDETVKSDPMKPPFDIFIRDKDARYSNGIKVEEKIITMPHWPEIEKTVSINEDVNSNSSVEQSFVKRIEKCSVMDLEESLREERAARAAISVELDKERNAAASAADEAMAMIHRLQDEKAAVEMEAMQFKRMVEEKSTFDAEEMVILKDILIRREREKHFLEKEVEAYRQLLVEADGLEYTLAREQNLPETKMANQENQESQERRALLVQEGDGAVLDMPYREEEEEENRGRNREMYKSDSEVPYSRVRDVYMVKDETEKKKKRLEESLSNKPEEALPEGIARKLPPLCRPRKKSLSSSGSSRRKSMSAVDYERLKIENEVELLRERLKAVQEERQELITRRASLPPLSSKVMVTSEKQRSWRRSSMDLHSS